MCFGSDMLRILHIFHNMTNGGVENFVMNYYRHIDRNKIQFDFITADECNGYFDKEIHDLGGKVYHISSLSRKPIKHCVEIYDIVRKNNYKIIHRHTGSCVAYVDLLAAKCGGAKKLIAHSHACHAGNKVAHYLSKMMFRMDIEKFACSKNAALWLFGKRAFECGSVKIISNAIDTSLYCFKDEKRNRLRDGLKRTVIGNVGRLNHIKNQIFLIKIAEELLKYNNRFEIWIIGDGENYDFLNKEIKIRNLEGVVKLFGNRDDVPDLLQAMDLFILPSLSEGFPIVLVEAQCAGLRCISSYEAYCDEINFANLVTSIKLSLGASEWANVIMEQLQQQSCQRENSYTLVRNAGFDIDTEAEKLQNIYLNMTKDL